MKPIRVLLVDDHPLFRKGLSGLLAKEKDFRVVGEAEDGKEAYIKARDLRPDLVLMDISMPRGDGLEATRRIKEQLPDTKVVILTVFEDDRNIFEAIKAGAHGYLLKSVPPEELFGMLRGVFRGEAPISRSTAAKILHEFAEQASRGPLGSEQEKLSAREGEVLAVLAKGLTNKEIANKLGLAENTVKNHLKNILGKLHLENRVQAATFALEKGLVDKKEEPQK